MKRMLQKLEIDKCVPFGMCLALLAAFFYLL